jgi:hypothetical protein
MTRNESDRRKLQAPFRRLDCTGLHPCIKEQSRHFSFVI